MVLCAVAVAACAQSAAANAGQHLLIDNHEIQSSVGLTRTIEQPQKRGVILDYAGSQNAQPYTSVLYENGLFRLWYNAGWDGLTSAPGVIGHKLGYLESRDGLTWNQASHVAQVTPPVAFGASVSRTPSGYLYAWWSADNTSWANAGMRLATSPNGTTWTQVGAGPMLTGIGDITSVFYDTARQRYVALTKDDLDEVRWVSQSTSRDLTHWTTPRLVVRADDSDAAGTQFYGIDGVVRRGGLLVGMLRVLNDSVEDGVGYTELVWSRDGETWVRSHEPFLPRTPDPAAFDHAMAWGSAQVVVGNRAFVYYGGYQEGHKTARYGGRRIGVATMLRDRYVAHAGTGRLVTKPLRLAGRLTVNAAGRVRVSFVNARGRTVASCLASGTDGVARRVGCAVTGTVRVVFRLTAARLYAFDS